MKNIRILIYILALILAASIAYSLGRSSAPAPSGVEYLPGETVRDTVLLPVPVHTEPAVILRLDTVYRYIYCNGPPTLDTIASLWNTARDWNAQRTYADTLFQSDTLGVLSYTASVQYNTLSSLSWAYTPRVKTEYRTESRIRPFFSARVNTLGQASAGFGTFIGRYGIEAAYVKDFSAQRDGLSVGVFMGF